MLNHIHVKQSILKISKFIKIVEKTIIDKYPKLDNLGENQVFVTTHSPLFLSQKDVGMHLVKITTEGTKVKKVQELEDLSQILSELGIRNSDLLLADFVLFIEGPSDEEIIKTWASILELDFDSKNIFYMQIGGSRNLNYYANSDILKKISQKSPIPYLFLIDRDEKSSETLDKICKQVDKIHILERREIENYFLNSNCILAAMREKAKDNPSVLSKLESVTPEQIEDDIQTKINEMKTIVILKRIKEEIGGGKFLSDDIVDGLIEEIQSYDSNILTNKICEAVAKTLNEKCSKEKISEIVTKQVSLVNNIWEDEVEKKKKIVPGKDILKAIFKQYNLKYNNTKDGQRIARLMKKEEILPEISKLLLEIKTII